MDDTPNQAPSASRPNRVIWGMLLLVVLLVGLALLVYATGLGRFFLDKDRLARFIHSLGAWGFAGLVLLQAFQVVVAVIPGEVTGFLGGYLYGPFLGVLLSTIGLTLGSYIAFTLSRVFGRPLMERFVDSSTISRFNYLLHHRGAFLVFLLFLIPGFPKDYLCYILGLGRLTTREFLLIVTAGRLFGTVLLTLGGSYLRQQHYDRLLVLLGLAICVIGVIIVFRDKIEARFRRWQDARQPK